MENSPYMEAIIASRAMLLDDETALEGSALISLETSEDEQEASFYEFVREHFASFVRYLRRLDDEDQEMLLQYYVLGKTQDKLAKVYRTGQTVCSFRLRRAVKLLLGYLILGDITQERIREIFVEAGIKDKCEGVPLSLLIVEYAKCRSFARVAFRHNIHRPAIRRAITQAQRILEQKEGRANALSAYLHALIDRASAEGTGRSEKQRQKDGHTFFVCRQITGQFRVSTDDPDFPHLFCSRAQAG